MAIRPATIPLVLIFFSARHHQALAQTRAYPTFNDYAAVPANVELTPRAVMDSSPESRRWHTDVQEATRGCHNFAGGYCLVLLKAGFPLGYRVAIMSLSNGQVTWTPVIPEFGAEGKVDSSLLIVDPPDIVREYQNRFCNTKNGSDLECAGATTYYYHWDGKALVLLDSASVSAYAP